MSRLKRLIRVCTALAKASDERLSTAEHLSQSLAARTMNRRGLRANLWRRWSARLRRKRELAYAGLFALLLVGGAYAIDRLFGDGWIGGRSSPSPGTVAVLPFQDFSEDGGSYLAAGFTYYLAEHLGAVRGLIVVSPESMHRYDEEGFPIDSIVARHELNMRLVCWPAERVTLRASPSSPPWRCWSGGDNDRILGNVRGRAVNGPFFFGCFRRSTFRAPPGTSTEINT